MNFTYDIDRTAKTVSFYIESAANHSTLDFNRARQTCEDILDSIKEVESQE